MNVESWHPLGAQNGYFPFTCLPGLSALEGNESPIPPARLVSLLPPLPITHSQFILNTAARGFFQHINQCVSLSVQGPPEVPHLTHDKSQSPIRLYTQVSHFQCYLELDNSVGGVGGRGGRCGLYSALQHL